MAGRMLVLLMMTLLMSFLGTAHAGLSSAGYEIDEHVVVATDQNFKKLVSSHRTVLLEFYAPWCGHCKNLVPEYSAVARMLHQKQEKLGGDFNMVVAKCDATANRQLAMQQSVTGYPTVVLFQNGELVEKYTGERNFEDIIEYVRDMDQSCAEESSPQEKAASSGQRKPALAKKKKSSFRYAPGDLEEEGFVVVTDESHLDMLKESNKPWLIASFKNGCGHCRRMEGEWNDGLREAFAAGAAKGLRVAVIDAEGLDREGGLIELMPGYRGTPGMFSYVPAAIAPAGKAVAAQLITASRTKEMVTTLISRIQSQFFEEVDSPKAALNIARKQSLGVSHDLSFILITSPDNAQSKEQTMRFRTMAAEQATGMFLHNTGSSSQFSSHFDVTVDATQSAVVAVDSRGKKVAGHIYLSSSDSIDAAFESLADWVHFKTTTAFQWMSPVNQGAYFEATKNLVGLNKLGWAEVDSKKRALTAITVMTDGVPDDEYRAIIDEAAEKAKNSIFYFQHGGYLQRRFLYGLHCPDVANIPCINIHPIESPFVGVVRLSTLLNGPHGARYTQDKRSSLLNMIEDFHRKELGMGESFNVMDKIKVIGKIKSLALERGEDFNQPLNPLKYPPFSAPIEGDEQEGRYYRERGGAGPKGTKQDKPKPKPKPKPKSKPKIDRKKPKSEQSTKAKLQSKLKDLSQMVAALQKEINSMPDHDEWE